ncbi:thioesterase family protein [Natroniella sulfidigena]|uniref:thioesterase family protein n=1 Tax=Natroniella sulfidigena TaxID=723921 RepID=UPI00200AB2FE|nr:thioesterase family protein [Natroniella sulfidigena]MCK8817661.1 thioesterase family protein [Natroniella sulfidigena]
MEKIKPGLSGTASTKVTDLNTAKEYNSGKVDVYATPAMIALMEQAATKAVEDYLPVGKATVGTNVEVKHLTATPLEMKVTAKAELIEVDGRKLIFKVEAEDEVEKIGAGRHERFIIDLDKFHQRAQKKSN